MEATSPAFLSQNHLQNQETGTRVAQNYLGSLHSTRKQPAKPWKKPTTAPAHPSHPKVYQVEPINFKELVQKLTGAPGSQPESRELKVPPIRPLGTTGRRPLLESVNAAAEPKKEPDVAAKDDPLGFDLSPSSARFWEAFPLLSPANLSRW